MNLWIDQQNALTWCECICVALCTHAKPESVLDRVRYSVPYCSSPDWHQACVILVKCHEYHRGMGVITSGSVLLVGPGKIGGLFFAFCALILKFVEWDLNVMISVKGTVHLKIYLLWNRDILKNVGVRTILDPIDFQCMDKK